MTVQYSPVSAQTAELSDVMKNIYKQRRKRPNKGKSMFEFNGSHEFNDEAIWKQCHIKFVHFFYLTLFVSESCLIV